MAEESSGRLCVGIWGELPSLPHFKMDGLTKCSNDKSTSSEASKKQMVPKEEVLDYELPSETMLSRRVGDNIASSSGSSARSFFAGMGFLPSCVDKAIEENGEDNVDLLLETLITYSAVPKTTSDSSDSGKAILCMNSSTPTQPAAVIHPKQVLQRSNSDSADSLDSLFDDKGPDVLQDFSIYNPPKEEPDEFDVVEYDKRSSLLSMKFTLDEVEFAIDKLGEDGPLNELVDFIIAAQIAGKLEKEDNAIYVYEEKKEDVNNETLFGTMDKTLRLLEMGFTENDVSLAIERFGSDIAISELAASIVEGRIAGNFVENEKFISKIFSGSSSHSINGSSRFGREVKIEDFGSNAVYQQVSRDETIKGKRPKQESMDDRSNGVFRFVRNHEDSMPKEENMDEISDSLFHLGQNQKGKRPKLDHAVNRSFLPNPAWQEEKFEASELGMPMPKPPKSNLSKRVDKILAKPPFFFYGNTHNISKDSWAKISQFMYGLEPEFANTQYFTALNRKEGYVHNLPTENRFHILPKSAMTIQDVIPQTKKWWPSWDMRKQLNCISSETTGVSQLCDKLGKLLTDCQGYPSAEQQGNILCHCRTLNLVWTGKNKLSPIEPKHLESILGYPIDHTQVGESGLMERLQLLKYSFQTDTIGYYLSTLKSIFPEGLTVLSVFSEIGGVEVALHRLGIPMKGVVSVDSSQMKRRILQKWWHKTEQAGELVQIEDIQKLTSSKIEGLIKKFGGFDLVICQNSCSDKTSSKPVGGDESVSGFEFSIFYEFVRVMQRVRSMMGRKK